MRLVDTHCHLSFEPLAGRVEAVLERASDRGISDVVAPAYDRASWDRLERLASIGGVHPALGIHPWAAREGLDRGELKNRLEACGAVAIGEIGLDFKVDACDRGAQEAILRDQLDLAAAMGLPVLLHCRGAFEELAGIIGEYGGEIRGALHAFSRGPQLAKRFLGLGLHLGFGGAITRPRADRARRSAATAPLERVLLETDAPSIGLDEVAPEDTEPGHVMDIAIEMARLRGIEAGEVAAATTANARALFGLG